MSENVTSAAETDALAAEYVLGTLDPDERAAAKKLSGKVALKGLVSGLIRKSDAGAVRLDLEGSHEVESAAKAADGWR